MRKLKICGIVFFVVGSLSLFARHRMLSARLRELSRERIPLPRRSWLKRAMEPIMHSSMWGGIRYHFTASLPRIRPR